MPKTLRVYQRGIDKMVTYDLSDGAIVITDNFPEGVICVIDRGVIIFGARDVIEFRISD